MADIMRRLALEDDMTLEEQTACTQVLKTGSLFVILNAACRAAEREGLSLEMNLSRPRAKKRRTKRNRGVIPG